MKAQEKLNRISDIFHRAIEAEVSNCYEYGKPRSNIITLWNIKGDIYFCDKYHIVGDGDGGNELLTKIFDPDFSHTAPTLVFSGNGDEYKDEYWLKLGYSDINSTSYFIKKQNSDQVYRLNNEDILENEEFKKYIVQIITDIAPDSVAEVQQLLA